MFSRCENFPKYKFLRGRVSWESENETRCTNLKKHLLNLYGKKVTVSGFNKVPKKHFSSNIENVCLFFPNCRNMFHEIYEQKWPFQNFASPANSVYRAMLEMHALVTESVKTRSWILLKLTPRLHNSSVLEPGQSRVSLDIKKLTRTL